ncbi:transglutaminaseTgpA domain-containing protein [Streptomyces sp. NPDC057702]|uniref:transglutaminase family protein n=1 Tax=unclassified Streptomyces TaxID=2593676 RepID=UPI0036B24D9A
MSGSARLALCATVATLAASCALLPLVDASGWLLLAVALLTLQSGVGVLARRVPLARPLTILTQALAGLLLLTVSFAREQAVAGVLPSPGVFRELGRLLSAGVDDVERYAIPAPSTTGIELLLVGGVLAIGLVVDALAVTFRSAAPAGLPLLALFSIAAGLSDGGSDWLWFLAAGAGFLVLLLAEGRDRLSQWGRVFGGGGPRGQGRASSGLDSAGMTSLSPVRTGRRISVLALGIALAVPAVLPSLDGGLLDHRSGDGSGGDGRGGTIAAINPVVSLKDNLNQPENTEVLRYRTSAPKTNDMYLRVVALDQFNGSSWKPSKRRVQDIPDPLPTAPGLSSDIRTTPVETTITAADVYAQVWLPLPYPASALRLDGNWRFEPEGRTVVGDRGQNARGIRYEVSSLAVEPTAGQLAQAPPPPPSLLREYTKVPDSLPGIVSEKATEITQGARNAYEQAVKLQDWFSLEGGFRYDTQVDAGEDNQAIARFLQQREGFCVHFSYAMAAMSRTLGIPARVAVGFTPGTAQADGSMSVGLRDAHAWPELYFEGVGWTRFEPTPSRGSEPDYTVEDTPSDEDPTQPLPQPTRSDEPSPRPSASESCTADMKRLGECGGPAPSGPDDDDRGSGLPWVRITLIGVGALAVAIIPVLPLLWRTRIRSRRLGTSTGRTPEAAAARTVAAWEELLDTGWDYGIAPDESLTPRGAAARIVAQGQLTGVPAEAAHRVAAAVEETWYAPRPRPVTGLAEDVRQVAVGLREAATKPARLRALLLPRSAARVATEAAQYRAALLDRWRASAWQRKLTSLRLPTRQRS